MSKFWNFIMNDDLSIAELRIHGEIVDDDDQWLYEFFGIKSASANAFREELSQHKGKNIVVWIDSAGGSVFAAAGIYNALKSHGNKISVKIDGRAFSAASVIAMAGDEISISPLGVMMVHNPLGYGWGESKDLIKAAEVLATVKEAIINAYELKTGRTRAVISQMMDNETWLSASEAVNEKFADRILYSENEIENNTFDIKNHKGFNFDRLAVVNCTTQSINKAAKIFGKLQEQRNDSLNLRLQLNYLRRRLDD